VGIYLPLGLLYWISLNFEGQTGCDTVLASRFCCCSGQ
jgi:hypothetical protein